VSAVSAVTAEGPPAAGGPQIGIFGRKADPQVVTLSEALAARGARPRVVDFFNFPRFNVGSMEGEGGAYDDINQPEPVDLGALELVHLRPACFVDEPADDAAALRDHYRRQLARLAFQLGLARTLARRVPVINPPGSFLFHRMKAHQHLLLLRHGIPTPEAVITQDEARARAFIRRHDGRVVAKPLASGAEVVLADEAFWAGDGRHLPARPFIFQRYVSGRSMRVYLLGGRIASAGELHYDPALVDWRERTTGATPWEPPPDLVAQLRRAVRLLELPCCGVDVEWDEATGRHYLLDLNPAALFVGWGRMLGLDTAGQLADYLLRVQAQGDPWLAVRE
jgi:glutathione synthase/RimK-type ligase-like ATP-grasp enzyme